MHLHAVCLLFITVIATGKSFEPCADGTPLKDYTGTISVTNGGRTCQRWSSNDTHAHSYTTSDFPLDDSVESVVNYCRSIEGNTPFCLTNDPHVRGQNCDKQICGGATCGGIRTDPHGELRSLDSDGDGQYDINMDCLWTLTAPVDQHIVLEILSMDIEEEYACLFDFLEIYELTSGTFFSHGRYCGVFLGNVTSLGSVLHVRFYSDDYYGGDGFVAIFSHSDAAASSTEGETQYPVGKLMCPGNVDIGMYRGTVNVTNGGRACQNWASVTPHRHSFKDEMFLVDGSLEEAHNYCRNIGDDPLPWCITTDEEKFYQHCYEHICAGVPCGGKLTNPEGWLMAIDREPDGYFDLYRDCLWELEAPLDHVVAVIVFDVFIDLQVDPNCEYIRLMLYEVSLDTKIVCVNDPLPLSYVSEMNVLFVRFISNYFGPGPGFNLTYMFTPARQWTNKMTTIDPDKSTATLASTAMLDTSTAKLLTSTVGLTTPIQLSDGTSNTPDLSSENGLTDSPPGSSDRTTVSKASTTSGSNHVVSSENGLTDSPPGSSDRTTVSKASTTSGSGHVASVIVKFVTGAITLMIYVAQ